MSLGTVLLVVLILALLGVIPGWPHSRGWGYTPVGVVVLLLALVFVMRMTGNL